jgi:hypothetical protein
MPVVNPSGASLQCAQSGRLRRREYPCPERAEIGHSAGWMFAELDRKRLVGRLRATHKFATAPFNAAPGNRSLAEDQTQRLIDPTPGHDSGGNAWVIINELWYKCIMQRKFFLDNVRPIMFLFRS